jgi:prefoldin subunit 5
MNPFLKKSNVNLYFSFYVERKNEEIKTLKDNIAELWSTRKSAERNVTKMGIKMQELKDVHEAVCILYSPL